MSEKDKLVEQYNDLCEALGIVKPKAILEACVVLDKIVELAKAEATKWHYPSKGEYPPSGEEVLCLLWGTTPDVGCWNEKDKLWHFDEFEEEDVDCWQYIIPPQEEA